MEGDSLLFEGFGAGGGSQGHGRPSWAWQGTPVGTGGGAKETLKDIQPQISPGGPQW